MSRHLYLSLISILLLACTSATSPAWQGARVERYLRAHSNTPPNTAEAMPRGHILIGMTREQVVVTVGEPKIRSQGKGNVERWLYSAAPFHQDHSSHGATLARISFIAARVAHVEFF